MRSIILTKKQLKRARYLANVNFGPGSYYRRIGGENTKVRNYVDADGVGAVWTETPSGSNFTVTTEFVSKGYSECDGDLDELLTILGFDTDAKNALRTDDYVAGHDSESKPHQDIVDATKTAMDFIAQSEPPAEPEGEVQDMPSIDKEVHLDEAEGKDQTGIYVDTINPREKLRKCATMRLAKEYGIAPETELNAIVEKFGTDAITRYQDLLGKVPSFGLTEADVRHVFPTEYVSLPL